jgi:23S rRNA pseudouridine2457 synthase
MVSQFVSCHAVNTLSDLSADFPPGIHAIGRLDKNSEGLLLLTTDKSITRLLFQSAVPHKREYLVQVKGLVSPSAIALLKTGVEIPVSKGEMYSTRFADACVVDHPVYQFSSGYELHPNVPYTWINVSLFEGKFHQVRKMMSAIGHPCKRLIRTSIEDLNLGSLKPGEVAEISRDIFYHRLKIGDF